MKRGCLKSQIAENQPPEPSVPDTKLSPGTFLRGGSLPKTCVRVRHKVMAFSVLC